MAPNFTGSRASIATAFRRQVDRTNQMKGPNCPKNMEKCSSLPGETVAICNKQLNWLPSVGAL